MARLRGFLVRVGVSTKLEPNTNGLRGSTLSLAYAETHPERCTALILRGIFTFQQEELDFLFRKGGASCERWRKLWIELIG